MEIGLSLHTGAMQQMSGGQRPPPPPPPPDGQQQGTDSVSGVEGVDGAKSGQGSGPPPPPPDGGQGMQGGGSGSGPAGQKSGGLDIESLVLSLMEADEADAADLVSTLTDTAQEGYSLTQSLFAA